MPCATSSVPWGNLENCSVSPFSAPSNLPNPRTMCSTGWPKGVTVPTFGASGQNVSNLILYRNVTVAWSYGGSQDLEQWVTLHHTAIQLLYSAPFPDPEFGVPEKCPICLELMHFPHTTECGHTFHKGCLERTQSPTCLFCRQTV
ncbi:hypothetical protein TNCT_17871 [Trichonephila clavata]|uniref:RING-type domain-containing protein n=1 Tax=Trichonephila clavata TaxID=2740835 RepID=A0A8X6IPC9_TRICU|nr:hypothetical protein TNCT_17871 [Trichonephila clavata]